MGTAKGLPRSYLMRMETPAYDRLGAGIAVAVVHGLLAYALLLGLTARLPLKPADALKIFNVLEPPPPPVKPPQQPQNRKHAGRASPANLHAKPTEVVKPPPRVQLPVPPPIAAAPVAGPGAAATAGASNVRGPGTGAGGAGNGLGSGGSGDGDGDGDVPPRQIKGDLRMSDFPAALRHGDTVSLSVRYYVEVDGHVSDCAITRSSGVAEFDVTACLLIRQRYRFKPPRSTSGEPHGGTIEQNYSWTWERDDSESPRDAR